MSRFNINSIPEGPLTTRIRPIQNPDGTMSEIIISSGKKSCADGYQSTSTMCEENPPGSGNWECIGENVIEGGGCPGAPVI